MIILTIQDVDSTTHIEDLEKHVELITRIKRFRRKNRELTKEKESFK